jgi:hypothetical protein
MHQQVEDSFFFLKLYTSVDSYNQNSYRNVNHKLENVCSLSDIQQDELPKGFAGTICKEDQKTNGDFFPVGLCTATG